jgi:membrane-bound serine protease (ClpP class)
MAPALAAAVIASAAAAVFAGERAAAPAPAPPGPIAVIPIHGEIDGLAARSFARRLELALAAGPSVVVLDMDTWGGELQAAYDMADRVKRIPVDSVALVENKAISAGALISLAAGSIAMLPDSRLGDCEPITVADGEMRTAPEKVKTTLRSDFENFALKNGYPPALAVAMVDKDFDDVVRVTWEDERGTEHTEYARGADVEAWGREGRRRVLAREVVVPRGQLLTMSDRKAEEFGFAMRVRSREELFQRLSRKAGAPLEARTFEAAGWEPWAALVSSVPVQALLLFLGLLGILIELTHPGHALPGALGLAALALACGGGYVAGHTTALDMALVGIGLLLLAGEVFFLPGHGVLALSGIACIVVGGFLSLQSFGLPATRWEAVEFRRNLKIFGGGFAATIAAFALALRFLPGSPLFRRLVLSSEQRPEDGYTVATGDGVALLGRRGVAASTLRPAGSVLLGETRLDALAQGEWIEQGAPVEVVETRGSAVVVRRVKA